jgi:hypothetical protein
MYERLLRQDPLRSLHPLRPLLIKMIMKKIQTTLYYLLTMTRMTTRFTLIVRRAVNEKGNIEPPKKESFSNK